jgi:hypothetical protein
MYVAMNLTRFLRELIRVMFIIGHNNSILLPAMKISLLVIREVSLILSEYFSKILQCVICSKICVPLPIDRMMGAADTYKTLQLNKYIVVIFLLIVVFTHICIILSHWSPMVTV